jgi:hypothetical protein
MSDTLMEARARWEEAVSNSLKVIADSSHAGDVALLDAIEKLITRVLTLEEQVGMLMELHRIGEDK